MGRPKASPSGLEASKRHSTSRVTHTRRTHIQTHTHTNAAARARRCVSRQLDWIRSTRASEGGGSLRRASCVSRRHGCFKAEATITTTTTTTRITSSLSSITRDAAANRRATLVRLLARAHVNNSFAPARVAIERSTYRERERARGQSLAACAHQSRACLGSASRPTGWLARALDRLFAHACTRTQTASRAPSAINVLLGLRAPPSPLASPSPPIYLHCAALRMTARSLSLCARSLLLASATTTTNRHKPPASQSILAADAFGAKRERHSCGRSSCVLARRASVCAKIAQQQFAHACVQRT